MRRLFSVVPVALVLVACGSGPKPAPDSLASALGRVDRLVASHQYAQARLALDDLVRRTAAARASGALDEDRAQRITAAAARLSAALPVATRTTVRPSPTSSPTSRPAPERQERHDRKKHKGHDEGDKGD